MITVNLSAVLVAAIVAFVVSTAWYITFNRERMKLLGTPPADRERPKMQPGKMLLEIIRNILLAYILAHFVILVGATDWQGAVEMGLWLWIAFPFLILAGSVLWDKVPVKLAALHAGDWLLKLVIVTAILGSWH